MGASSTKSIAGSQSETKQASTRVGVAPARPSGIDGMFGGIAAMFGNEGMLRTMRAKQAENHSGQTGRKPIEAPASEAESAAARITRITFDKTSMQAIFYLEDAFGSTTETREVLDHSDPAPGVYIAQVFRDHDGRLNWRLPRGASAQPGKGFVFVAKERAPGTLAGVSQIEVHVIGGAAGEFLTTGTASRSPPMDAETRARIGEKLLQAGVTAEDVDLFLAGAGEPSLSAGDFEHAVDEFLKKRRQQHETRGLAMSNLAHAMDFVGPGTGGSGVDVTMVDVYRDYLEYRKHASIHNEYGLKDLVFKSPRQLALEAKLYEHYDIGLPEFEKRIGVFEREFRAATVNLAYATLARAEGICNRYLRELPEAGTLGVHEKPAQMVRALDPVRSSIVAELEAAERESMQARARLTDGPERWEFDNPGAYEAIKEQVAAAELAQESALGRVTTTLSSFPIAQLPNFASKEVLLAVLQAKGGADMAYLVNWSLLELLAGIKAVREQLAENSKRIYQLDSLVELAKQQFGLNVDADSERSIFELIIDGEVERAAEMSAWDQMLTVFQFALMLVSMAVPGAAVVTVPALATIRVRDAWVGIADHHEDHAAHQAGFASQESSQASLMLGLIDTVSDIGGMFQALRQMPVLRMAMGGSGHMPSSQRLAAASVPTAVTKVSRGAQTHPPEGKATLLSSRNTSPSGAPSPIDGKGKRFKWVSGYRPTKPYAAFEPVSKAQARIVDGKIVEGAPTSVRDLHKVNPARMIDGKLQQPCQNCTNVAGAVESSMRGKPVSAMGTGSVPLKTVAHFGIESSTFRGVWNPAGDPDVSGIKAEMRAAGPGSRGLIVAEWRFQPAGQDPRRPKAHVFNVMNIDGEVRFIDRQVRRRKLKLGLYTNFRFLLTQRGT